MILIKNQRNMGIGLILLLFFVFVRPIKGMLNPAQVYCEALGYRYLIGGLCVLPDGREVDAWEFFEGKVGKEYSGCKKMGLEIKTVNNPEKCIRFLLDECAVCILQNGTEVEVSELMGLSFEETKCGDGVCGFPENYENCPKDCKSGSLDYYCDAVIDGICDPDCSVDTDKDCNVCGNKKCEPFENNYTCCIDCKCNEGFICKNNTCIEERCGNEICESFSPYEENYENCPKDCKSGSLDYYCDAVIDGICDPDCKIDDDLDCVKTIDNWVYFLIIGVPIVLIFILIVFGRRK